MIPAKTEKAIFNPYFNTSAPAIGANKPQPSVPPSRMRPYIALCSPSIDIVALSLKEPMGEINILNRAMRIKITAKLVKDGSRSTTMIAAVRPRLIINL